MEIDWKRAWYFISQILSLFGFAFIGLFASQSVALLIGQAFFNISFEKAADVIADPALEAGQVVFLRIFQMLTNFGTFALPVILYAKAYRYPFRNTLKLNSGVRGTQYVLITVFALAALFGLSLLSDLNGRFPFPERWKLAADQMEATQRRLIEAMMFMPSALHLVSNLFVVGMVAAFSEELMFRGILQPLFKNWTKNIHLGILISAAIFSAIHFDLYNFIPRMAIGVGFGYLFYWSGSLWVTILAHFLNNAIEVVVYYYRDSNSWFNYFLEIKYVPLIWGIGSMAVILGVMYIFKKQYHKPETRNAEHISEG
jgi:membrane protease YdiL (CAAX protease family)